MDRTSKDPAGNQPETRSRERQARRPERLWTLQKDAGRIDADLYDDSAIVAGVELLLLKDGAFWYARRHASRDLAIQEATECLRDFEAQGWWRIPASEPPR